MDDNGIDLSDALRDAHIQQDAMQRTIVHLKGLDHPDATVNLGWINEEDRFKLVEAALAIFNDR